MMFGFWLGMMIVPIAGAQVFGEWLGPKLRAWWEERVRRVRTPVAFWLDKRRPDMCWVDLYLWATMPDLYGWLDLPGLAGSAGHCERVGDEPYCGKCRVTGYRRGEP
jgi:hypothetical protein